MMELGHPDPTRRAVRLLVVEDERDLLRVLEKTFREEGYAVDTALGWRGRARKGTGLGLRRRGPGSDVAQA